MKANPWLFRRLVRIGVIEPTLPVYVFSDAAAKEVALLNGRVEQEAWGELAVMPHAAFCVEMSVQDALDDGFMFRTLTVAMHLASVGMEAPMGPLQNIEYLIGEFQAIGSAMVWLPEIWMTADGKHGSLTDETIGKDVLRKATERQRAAFQARCNLRAKHAADLHILGVEKMTVRDYNVRAGEAVSFLRTACAVMASPAVSFQSGVSRAGKAPTKGGERDVTTKWTHVDVDLDRSGDRDQSLGETNARGVALHPVRAHLRVTRYGISPVRAHMRGDAQYGVRYRVGNVSRSGD